MAKDYSARQHTIPLLLLKHFTDGNGVIWSVDKKTEKTFYNAPENIAVVKHIYSIKDANGEKSDILEKQFEKREYEIAPIIKTILKTKQWPEKIYDRLHLVYFLCFLGLRAPYLIRSQISENIQLKAKTEKGALKLGLSPDISLGLLKSGKFYAAQIWPSISTAFEQTVDNFDVCLYISDKAEFILTDIYIGLESSHNLDLVNIASLEQSDFVKNCVSKVYCPLSPRICVVFVKKNKQCSQSTPDWSIRHIDTEETDKINVMRASRFPDRYLYASNKEILEKIYKQVQNIQQKRKRQLKKFTDKLRNSVF